VLLVFLSCSRSNNYNDVNYREVKSIRDVSASVQGEAFDLNVAVAPLTSNVETYIRTNRLIAYTAARCSLKIKTTYFKKNAEIYRLLESKSVDIAFISSVLYVIGKRKNLVDLLAVPVKHGKPTHHACIIVQKSSPIRSWSDLEGKRFAFTDELSLTGYYFPIRKSGVALAHWHEVYFTGSHDQSVSLVNRGLVDGASVDGSVLDEIIERSPESAANVRVMEVSPEYGMQPIVVGKNVPSSVRSLIQRSFLSMNSDSTGKSILAELGIDKFIPGDDSLYASVYAMVPETITP
jgi:phosphonate transport system substrate-binding protein